MQALVSAGSGVAARRRHPIPARRKHKTRALAAHATQLTSLAALAARRASSSSEEDEDDSDRRRRRSWSRSREDRLEFLDFLSRPMLFRDDGERRAAQ